MNQSLPVLECCPVLEAPLAKHDAERLAGAFKAVADPARLRLLGLIAAQPQGACTCDLTEPLGLTQPTVTHHLRILHDAGLLSSERRGVWTFYTVVPERLRALRDVLA